jgi:hypothetical protein
MGIARFETALGYVAVIALSVGFHTKGRALVIPRLRLESRGGKDAPRFQAKAHLKRARRMGSGWV